ncbi:MAG: HlyD family efflux transporter periplasmic adaptor subunit [Pseudonocardiaceae bacterium]|nr:MAG: HlyD family efflux transporter periplasmic adaptor subunit [Pseudonocardiaceae bacterium]
MTAALRMIRMRRRVWIAAGAALVLVVALVVTGVANADDSGNYRTAMARTGDVASTLDAAGTVTPTSEDDLSFPIAGQVSSVPVAVGQQVAAGTTLASLDTTTLDAAVAQARSTLATAQAKLDADQSGQSSAASGGSGSGAVPASFGGGPVVVPATLTLGAPPSGAVGTGRMPLGVSPALGGRPDDTFGGVAAWGSSPNVSPGLGGGADDTFAAVPAGLIVPAVSAAGGDAVSKAQAAVLADQRTVDGLLAAAQRDLTAETTACTPVLAATATEPGTAAGSSAGSSAGSGSTSSGSTGSGSTGSGSGGSGTSSGSGSSHGSTHTTAAAYVTGGGTMVPIATSSTAAELAACQAAIKTVMAGQQTVATAQRTLATDENALDAALAAAIGSGSGGSGSGGSGSGTGGAGGAGAGGTGSGGSGAGSGGAGSGGAGAGAAGAGGSGAGGSGTGGAGAGGAGGSAGTGTGQGANGQGANGQGANGMGANGKTPNGMGANGAGGAGQRQGAAGAGRSGGTAGGGAGRTTVVPAAQLAADQAQVDSASAQLTTAEQNRDQATLVAPIAGTVAAVNVTAGRQVGGSAGSAQIVVIGPGADEVVVPVPESTIGSVHVGDAATIVADGSDQQLTGKVASVGLLPGGTGSPVNYPVTIALTGTPPALPAGSGATVTLTVASATAVLTVPTSAVHTGPGRTTVDVLRGGKPATVPVTVGAAGATATQITSGLQAGDEVVLADLSQPLPTGGTAGLRTLGGGGGGGAGGGGGRTGG